MALQSLMGSSHQRAPPRSEPQARSQVLMFGFEPSCLGRGRFALMRSDAFLDDAAASWASCPCATADMLGSHLGIIRSWRV